MFGFVNSKHVRLNHGCRRVILVAKTELTALLDRFANKFLFHWSPPAANGSTILYLSRPNTHLVCGGILMIGVGSIGTVTHGGNWFNNNGSSADDKEDHLLPLPREFAVV